MTLSVPAVDSKLMLARLTGIQSIYLICLVTLLALDNVSHEKAPKSS